ncbi:hypothetical protein J6590_061009 [Homalodisca vitripennis]|nr:hypothetical protein J6590_061009 [Homalodisca vitripennis]
MEASYPSEQENPGKLSATTHDERAAEGTSSSPRPLPCHSEEDVQSALKQHSQCLLQPQRITLTYTITSDDVVTDLTSPKSSLNILLKDSFDKVSNKYLKFYSLRTLAATRDLSVYKLLRSIYCSVRTDLSVPQELKKS